MRDDYQQYRRWLGTIAGERARCFSAGVRQNARAGQVDRERVLKAGLNRAMDFVAGIIAEAFGKRALAARPHHRLKGIFEVFGRWRRDFSKCFADADIG